MLALFKRDMSLALRSNSSAMTVLLFYLVIIVVVPLVFGNKPLMLATIGPSILWFSALLAGLLGLDRLFQVDFEDGSLDQMLLSSTPLSFIIFIRCLAHWLVTGLPVVMISPVFAFFLSLDRITIEAVAVTLLFGTPAISFIGAIGAAVTLSLPRGGLLLSSLILPLCIPVIIFGVGAVKSTILKTEMFFAPFLLMCSVTLFFAVLGPFAAACALKKSNN
ncbi:heme exporter protein CcmB [Candidatus Endowatersipora endosymbiont of Watersipora subatra]|uniref:heme exporter protein CcmB n=1 Tax=Candidatus Endowatersipora endosymbiont of Watersipora subatra TaxID=3077946 RepID=UPI00312C91C5